MRRIAMAALLAGCGFQHGSLGAGDAMVDTPSVDTPPDAPPRCLDGWCLRKPITIHGADVAGPITELVLLVRTVADPDLAGSTGEDLRFTTASGQPLSYEREKLAANGALHAWVRLPSLDPVDTTIYLYYGKQGVTDQQDPAATWAAHHAAVWHLDENVGAVKCADATFNGNTAIPTNSPTLASNGQLGRGATFDGIDDYLTVPPSSTLAATVGSATFALWINWDSLTSTHQQRVLTTANRFVGTGDGYELSAQPAGDFFMYPWGGAQTYNLGPNPFTAGTWQYLVATLDYPNHALVIYVDGAPMTFTIENAPTAWTSPGSPDDLIWGSNSTIGGAFAGMMDEIQVMNIPVSADWVKTAYANQKLGSTMVTVGPAQMLDP